eukprot:7383597-Karenia_brevis.AAC.1
MVMSLSTSQWPELHAYMVTGLTDVSQQEFDALAIALPDIFNGMVDRGQHILKNAGFGLQSERAVMLAD